MTERVAGEIGELLGEDPDSSDPDLGQDGRGRDRAARRARRARPAAPGDLDAPARALIFDSEFDQYRGIVNMRVVDGTLKKDDAILAMQAGTLAEIDEIGFFGPSMMPVEQLRAGEVGYVITGIKDVSQLRVGDTLTTRSARRPSRCRATARSSRWFSAGCSPLRRISSRTCATRSRSCR